MKDFPTRYYDIMATTKIPGDLKSLKRPPRSVNFLRLSGEKPDGEASEVYGKMINEGVPVAFKAMNDARLFFAPGNLSERIYSSHPSAIIGSSLRLPFENMFIEFATPLRGCIGELGSPSKGDLCYGVHIVQADFQTGDSELYTFFLWWYRKFPDPGYWSAATQILHLGSIAKVSESRLELLGSGREKKIDGDLRPLLKHLSFVLFLNSSNISYEIRKSPKMPRPKDKSWWRNSYESKFEELVVKDIPKRIALSLRRNESGAGWSRSAFVRGHFKVMSYCGVCGMKRAVLRFLRGEICKCGSPLNPETAKTQTFWWEGHWAGPDIVDKVVAVKA